LNLICAARALVRQSEKNSIIRSNASICENHQRGNSIPAFRGRIYRRAHLVELVPCPMTKEDAIRYLDHQAAQCRGRDACEALCLLLPALMRILELEPMDDLEARAVHYGIKLDLAALDNSGEAGKQGGKGGRQNRHYDNPLPRPGPSGMGYADRSSHETTQNPKGSRGPAHVAERPTVGRPA
jgi:hypothetical protein